MPQPRDPDEAVQRRRSRRRATAQEGPPTRKPEPVTAAPATVETPAVERPTVDRPAAERPTVKQQRQPRGRGRAASARGERDLAGPGSSQVGPTGAMRARDLNRPGPDDLAEAEAELTIVRRNWTAAESEQPRRRRS